MLQPNSAFSPHKKAGASNVDDTQFVIEQLLQLSTMLDYTDEAGRRALAHTLRYAA